MTAVAGSGTCAWIWNTRFWLMTVPGAGLAPLTRRNPGMVCAVPVVLSHPERVPVKSLFSPSQYVPAPSAIDSPSIE